MFEKVRLEYKQLSHSDLKIIQTVGQEVKEMGMIAHLSRWER